MYAIITSYNITYNLQIKADMQVISSNIVIVSENNVQIVIRVPSIAVYNKVKQINNVYSVEETIDTANME